MRVTRATGAALRGSAREWARRLRGDHGRTRNGLEGARVMQHQSRLMSPQRRLSETVNRRLLALATALCAAGIVAIATGDAGAENVAGTHIPRGGALYSNATWRSGMTPLATATSQDNPEACLLGAIMSGFSLVTFEGGRVWQLGLCAERRGVAQLFVADAGEYVAYVVGAPAHANARFRALFANGVPAYTPMWALSRGAPSPAPEVGGGKLRLPACLHGGAPAPLTLRVYEGGRVFELEECGTSLHLGRLYAFHDGGWLPLIIDNSIEFDAKRRANREFHQVFADSVPPGTPLFAYAGDDSA